MRWVKPALCGSLLLALASGCPKDTRHETQEASADCRYTLLRPEGQELLSWDQGQLHDRRSCFGHSLCAAGTPDVFAARTSEHTLLLEVGEAHFERPVQGTRQAGLKAVLAGKGAALLLAGDALELLLPSGTSERFPWPKLTPEERLAGLVLVGDGVGLRLRDRAHGKEPARPFVWLRPPSAEAPRAAGSTPFLTTTAEHGWLRRRSASSWEVELPTGKRVTLELEGDERPHVWSDGERVVLWSSTRLVATSASGSYAHEQGRGDTAFGTSHSPYLLLLRRGLFRADATALEPVLARSPGRDLGGNKLPAGAEVERLRAASDHEGRLAVVERLRLPSCRVEDRVHEVLLQEGRVTTLASGPGVRLHPLYARGRLRFVEAEARYEAVGSAVSR